VAGELGTVQEDAVDEEHGLGPGGRRGLGHERRLALDVVHGADPRAAGAERLEEQAADGVVVVAVAVERLWSAAVGVALRPRAVEAVDRHPVHLAVRCDEGCELATQHGLPGAVDPVERHENPLSRIQRHELGGQIAEDLRAAARRGG
jgi:hypothetical protein